MRVVAVIMGHGRMLTCGLPFCPARTAPRCTIVNCAYCAPSERPAQQSRPHKNANANWLLSRPSAGHSWHRGHAPAVFGRIEAN
ncbi:hypothetical protein RR11_1110 [Ruegeria sp. R11]|nr:hypothetical protein RR11_1110 [Ruegeria sp. R11]